MTVNNEGSVKPMTNTHWHYWLLGIALVLALLWGVNLVNHNRGNAQAESSTTELDQLRTTLLADTTSLRGNWLRTLNPLVQDVQGDLVWNKQQQQGVMRFINLPNPNTGKYYQLLIYDTHSVDSKPISGAVLHTGSGKTETLNAISPQTHITEPYKFELVLRSDNVDEKPQLLLMVQP